MGDAEGALPFSSLLILEGKRLSLTVETQMISAQSVCEHTDSACSPQEQELNLWCAHLPWLLSLLCRNLPTSSRTLAIGSNEKFEIQHPLQRINYLVSWGGYPCTWNLPIPNKRFFALSGFELSRIWSRILRGRQIQMI